MRTIRFVVEASPIHRDLEDLFRELNSAQA